jgi:hypothetical protein
MTGVELAMLVEETNGSLDGFTSTRAIADGFQA